MAFRFLNKTVEGAYGGAGAGEGVYLFGFITDRMFVLTLLNSNATSYILDGDRCCTLYTHCMSGSLHLW